MLDKPQIVQTNVQLTAIIPLTIPRNEIGKVMGPGSGNSSSARKENRHEADYRSREDDHAQ